VISVALYETIQEWHGSGVGTREIARRLKIDVKTVRRHLRKIEAGILAPKRSSPVSKLDPFSERIAELAASGCTAWNVHVALADDPLFDASYELVKSVLLIYASMIRACMNA
jgi:transposase